MNWFLFITKFLEYYPSTKLITLPTDDFQLFLFNHELSQTLTIYAKAFTKWDENVIKPLFHAFEELAKKIFKPSPIYIFDDSPLPRFRSPGHIRIWTYNWWH